MKVSVLSIGDELLIGQVVNTNASYIGRELRAIGATAAFQLTVGDTEKSIVDGLKLCLEESDAVLVTGGLGPTDDDITTQTIAKFTGDTLIQDDDWVQEMEKLFAARGRKMTANNLKQALIPSRATRIDNDCGSAPGVYLEPIPGKMVFVMPGVPYEMQSMMKRFVIPKISSEILPDMLKSFQRTIFTTGIGESLLAAKMDELDPPLRSVLKKYHNQVELAWLPSPMGVKLRITVREKSSIGARSLLDEIEGVLMKAAAPFVYGKNETFDEILLEDVLGKTLLDRKLTIAVAESCTGGLISSRLTNIAGSSKYVLGGIIAYSNDVKVCQLGVDAETLRLHGAVSEAVVREMCEGVRRVTGASVGVSVSGILGPDGGTPEKPVGTVWIAVSADGHETVAKKYLFENDRLRSKERASQAALDLVRSVVAKFESRI